MNARAGRPRRLMVAIGAVVVAMAVGVAAVVATNIDRLAGPAASSAASPTASQATLVVPSPEPSASPGEPSASAAPSPAPPVAFACPSWSTRRSSAAASTAPAGFSLRVPILMYHRIIPPALAGASLPDLVVPPAVFAAQMAALDKAGWRTITAGQLASDLQRGVRPPPRTFVITIDDGHSDGYQYAFPLLRAHHFVATFYVVAGRINHPGDLTASQLKALTVAGMEIADHTMSHANLTRQTSVSLRRQVMNAASRIAAATGCWPVTLAYPAGHYNATVVRFLTGNGFLLAVTEGSMLPETWSNRLVIGRVRVNPTTTPTYLVNRVRGFVGPAAGSSG